MTRKGAIKAAALAAATALTSPVFAQSVLRLDEVAVGELDAVKATYYANSILMFNVYDTLVLPNQGAPGHQPHLAPGWEMDGASYTFTLRDDVAFHSGNPLLAADIVYTLERMQALGPQHPLFIPFRQSFGEVRRGRCKDAFPGRPTSSSPSA